MIAVSYKRDRLVLQAIGIVMLALGALWLGLQSNFAITWRLLGWFLAVTLPFASVALVRKAIDGQLAIREVAQGLELSSLYGSRTVPWANLTAIERHVLQQSSAFGLIKQDLAHYIVFVGYEVGEGEFRIKIQEDLIDWPRAELEILLDQLAATWHARSAGPAIQPQPSRRLTSPGFSASTFGRRAV
jgi:hypothetical protein